MGLHINERNQNNQRGCKNYLKQGCICKVRHAVFQQFHTPQPRCNTSEDVHMMYFNQTQIYFNAQLCSKSYAQVVRNIVKIGLFWLVTHWFLEEKDTYLSLVNFCSACLTLPEIDAQMVIMPTLSRRELLAPFKNI